jgi:hypothetical protein
MARRELQEINAGSMADIAFLLLIFFLVATTMDIDTGITRLLPDIPQEDQITKQKINARNMLVVRINKNDQVLVGNQPNFPITQLKEKTIRFFTDPTGAEMEGKYIEFPPGSGKSSEIPSSGVWYGNVSKGVVSLQNDRSTSYNTYLRVQNELVAAVNQLRNDFCEKNFGKKFDELNQASEIDKEIYDGIRKIYPMSISEAEPIDYSK